MNTSHNLSGHAKDHLGRYQVDKFYFLLRFCDTLSSAVPNYLYLHTPLNKTDILLMWAQTQVAVKDNFSVIRVPEAKTFTDQSTILLSKTTEGQMAKNITQEQGLQFEVIIIKVLLTLYESLVYQTLES